MRIACPRCKKVLPDAPEDHPSRPFCSARCKLADLDDWLSGTYRISTPLGPGDLPGDPDDLRGPGDREGLS